MPQAENPAEMVRCSCIPLKNVRGEMDESIYRFQSVAACGCRH